MGDFNAKSSERAMSDFRYIQFEKISKIRNLL